MVLTDRQREDLHAGIYEYLVSRGEAFEEAAKAFAVADPKAAEKKTNNVGKTPLMEKKWTAIPRLQKKVLELERTVAQSAKIHAHRTGEENGGPNGVTRRMLPRLPCSHTLAGHSAPVTCVKVHPVFTVVVSGSEDGTIKVWDHESGDYIKTLKGHTNNINSLAFTPAGNYLASASNDLSIKLWDFTTYNCVRTLRGHDHTISSVAFLPLQNIIPTAAEDSSTGMDVAAANAKHLLSASRDNTVKLWDMETGFCDHTFTDHTDWVRTLAVRPHDGAVWASAGNDPVIYVYDANVNTKQKLCELRGHEHVVESLSFVVEETFGKDRGGSNAKHKETVRDYLASGGRDRTVRLWSLATASCLAVFTAHENWVKAVLIHPSGNYIISGGDDRTIRVFDIKANRCLRTLENAHDHFVSALDMHYTLPIMVSGGTDQLLKTWVLD
ncbi:WD repeat-containing protein [Nitzschia inconspicua]|uniref:Lissencephaly-1 homolog n=1 Tax=Nitzschia inconspicua TaxID=303405 RepID=A0A9K3KK84_9STRA|nr:WD repeat-containing protein [Nitzschia inconspicua]